MSNSRRAKWTAAQVTAANAERLLGGLWDEVEGEAWRRVVVRRLGADMAAAGAGPGMVAAMEQACAGLGTAYWARLWHDYQASA